MEAQSMNHIIELARNPPAHPRSLSGIHCDSLILYIERVPGSRDIILTPVKPRRKVVTVEDIASSLYFLHLRQANDANLTENCSDSSYDNVADEEIKKDMHLRRKPLNKNITPALPSRQPGEAVALPSLPTAEDETAPRSAWRSAGDGIQNPFLNKTAISGQTLLSPTSRRPLGPRPLSISAPVPELLLGKENVPLVTNAEPRPHMVSLPDPPKQPPRPSKPVQDELRAPFIEPPKPGLLSTASNGSLTTLAITIIRRNPSSGAQWNIGEITDFRNDKDDPSSQIDSHISDLRPAPGVRLFEPGYGHFSKISDFGHEKSSGNKKIGNPVESQRSFYRQIHKTTDPISIRYFQSRPNFTINGSSGSDRTSLFNNRSLVAYHFMSPWNGRCDVESVNGGKSYRCNHTFANTCVEVSELRFNLPRRPVSSVTALDANDFSTARLRNKFGHFRNNSSPEVLTRSAKPSLPADSFAALYPSDGEGDQGDLDDEVADSDEDGLGLALGREKAGGGRNGGRAKLGKLIIYKEGLKMLDLIVATNMAIWWERYGT